MALPSPEQQKVISYRSGHLQVIACAGAGKTEAISRRVSTLIEEGAEPAQIVAFTFTERAAESLKNRITSVVPGLLLAVLLTILRQVLQKLGHVGFLELLVGVCQPAGRLGVFVVVHGPAEAPAGEREMAEGVGLLERSGPSLGYRHGRVLRALLSVCGILRGSTTRQPVGEYRPTPGAALADSIGGAVI